MSFNKIILVGNLGRDPELRYTAQGTPVCSFSMATNERRKDRNGEMQDHTTWFRITLWNRLAETASQYLQKGKQVYIEGRLRVEEYVDRDGKPLSCDGDAVSAGPAGLGPPEHCLPSLEAEFLANHLGVGEAVRVLPIACGPADKRDG